MADGGCCEFCANYAYDEEDECYYCEVNLDEDEMYRFLSGSSRSCPYFQTVSYTHLTLPTIA